MTSRASIAAVGALVVALSAVFPARSMDWPPRLGRYEGGDMPHGMSMDCVLQAFNACSGWIWIYNEDVGAVWGTLFDAHDCPEICSTNPSVREIYLYSICGSGPGHLGGVGIASLDGSYCPTTLLYQSGPLTIVNCTATDRWTILETPPTPVSGPFAVTVTWGDRVSGVSNPQMALDDEYADYLCQRYPGVGGVYPGCASSQVSCNDWIVQGNRTFIFVTDANHDGTLDDLCAIYGAPLVLGIPYGYSHYGYASYGSNMLLGVGMECTGPSAVEPTSWGRVKALYR